MAENDKVGAPAPEVTTAKDPAPPAAAKETAKAEALVEKEAQPKPKAAEAKDGAKEQKDPPARKRLAADDDDLPEDDDQLLELSSTALKKRMDRYSKKEQRAIFEKLGVKGMDELEKLAARARALEEQEETRRREALDEKARLAEDLKKLKEERDGAVREARELRNSQVVEREDTFIKHLAEKHVKPRYVKYLLEDLRDHLRTEYTASQLKELGSDAKRKEKVLDKWFAERAAEDPTWSKDYDPKIAAAADSEKEKQKLTNGANSGGRPSAGQPSGQAANKTFAPGKPNSMTPAEARAEAKRQGYHW